MSDFKKFGFNEAETLSDMKSTRGDLHNTKTNLPKDDKNLPSSVTSGTAMRNGKSGFSNRPPGEGNW